ncbi:hypothetical protein PBY51_015359 [Eleginops maclovinus]|uniref:Uncharacterized protein n=1 Tax=Eleginops maclovinus TaxID=56733 RepID=A0AAN7X5A2_ELEMC|nr:hypothetical protein PBY51_015359 [Eleginops maclovinus]
MSVQHTQTSAVPSPPRSYKHVNEKNAALLLIHFPVRPLHSITHQYVHAAISMGGSAGHVLAGTPAEYVGRGLCMVINVSGSGQHVLGRTGS